MHILHVEHRVADFDTWKRDAFDADPVGRSRMRVRGHRIGREAGDPNFVTIDLEFDSREAAEAMHRALLALWDHPLARIGAPSARIVEVVEVEPSA